MAKKKDKEKEKDKIKGKDKTKAKDKIRAEEVKAELTDKVKPAQKKTKAVLAPSAKAAGTDKKKEKQKPPVKKAENVPSQIQEPILAPDVSSEDDAAKTEAVFEAGSIFSSVTLVYRDGLAKLQEALKVTEVSASQYEILGLLSPDRAVTQQELAKALYVSEGNITQMLTKMEKFGWVTRRRDWRTNFVTLTKEGQKVRMEASVLYENAAKAYFASLSAGNKNRLLSLLSGLLGQESAK